MPTSTGRAPRITNHWARESPDPTRS
jgi:hypothetical protein